MKSLNQKEVLNGSTVTIIKYKQWCNINNAPENRNANRFTVALQRWVPNFYPQNKSWISLKLIKKLRFIVMFGLILMACRNFVHLRKTDC